MILLEKSCQKGKVNTDRIIFLIFTDKRILSDQVATLISR